MYVLFGTEAAGLNEVRPFLDVLANNVAADACTITHIDDILQSVQLQNRIEQVLEDQEEGTTLVVVHLQCPWTGKWVALAGEMIARRGSAKRRLPQGSFRWWPAQGVALDRTPQGGSVPTRSSGIGRDVTLTFGVTGQSRQVEERGRVRREQQRRQPAIPRCHRMLVFVPPRGGAAACVERPHEWKSVVGQYQQEVMANPASARLGFGLVPEAEPVLQVMADYGGTATVEEVVALMENTPPQEHVKRVLKWADLLQLARPAGEQKWILDRFLNVLMISGPRDAKP